MRLLAFALLVTVGCFDPGQPSLRCSTDRPGCPDGLVCINDQCQQSNAADASTNDLSVADLSQPDMALPPGCAASNGRKIGTNGCWLCPGVFGNGTNPKAFSMCSPTHAPPLTAIPFSETDCLGVTGGFFVTNVYGSSKTSDPSVAECGKFTMPGLNPGFFGCGSASGSITVNANLSCSGFRQHIQCQTINGIQCLDQTFTNLSNTKAENGVICCPK